MPFSHHSHSGQFCKHGSGNLEDVVKEAIRQGFEVYALTEHVPRYRSEDLYPEEENMDLGELLEQFSSFLNEAHRLKALYTSRIRLLVGLETEYITRLDLHRLRDTLATFGKQIEFLVGSVHHVNGIPIDFDSATYERAVASCVVGGGGGDEEGDAQTRFLAAYFDAQYELMQQFKPEVIGHFDLCRLFRPSLRFTDYPPVWQAILRNIRFAVGYGALFEINAAAFRKKWDTAYPGRDIIEAIQSVNGRFALSDDSHGPDFVGLNYARVRSYMLSMGVTELWHLQHSDLPNPAGRDVQAVRVEGGWSGHEFWLKQT